LWNQGVHTSWATVRDLVASHSVATMVLPTDGGKVLRARNLLTVAFDFSGTAFGW
jgi:hypothetical protein